MIFPNNGKVVIIDDKYEDVKGLMASLSSNKVPFSYFQDEAGEDLPDNPIRNVRLVFLDMVLQLDSESLSPKAIVSSALGRLIRLIGINNGPYFLLVWSTEYERYIEYLRDELSKDAFKDIRPFEIIPLNKTELKNMGIKAINKALLGTIEQFDSLRAFFLWESIINDSIGELTNEFTSVVEIGEDWNNQTKNLLYKLSRTFWGELINKRGNSKLVGAYSTLNQILFGRINQNIISVFDRQIEDAIQKNDSCTSSFSSKVNSKLNISEYRLTQKISGEVFMPIKDIKERINNHKRRKGSKIENHRARRSPQTGTIKSIEGKYREKIRIENDKLPPFEKRFKTILTESCIKGNKRPFNKILKESIFIELNITPKCDSAQRKLRMIRLLPGVIIPSRFSKSIRKYADYSYVSDFVFHYNGMDYILIFDFRHLYSLLPDDVEFKTQFRLNDSLFNDLQVKLSSHINRIGLLYMS